MLDDNIVSAPQTAKGAKVYRLWRKTYTGSLTDFFIFMTQPSAEREIFVSTCPFAGVFEGETYTPNLTDGQ